MPGTSRPLFPVAAEGRGNFINKSRGFASPALLPPPRRLKGGIESSQLGGCCRCGAGPLPGSASSSRIPTGGNGPATPRRQCSIGSVLCRCASSSSALAILIEAPSLLPRAQKGLRFHLGFPPRRVKQRSEREERESSRSGWDRLRAGRMNGNSGSHRFHWSFARQLLELTWSWGWSWDGSGLDFLLPIEGWSMFFPSELPASWFSLLLQGEP